MRKHEKLIIGFFILILAAGIGMNQINAGTRPSWVHEVHWSNMPADGAKIEEMLWTEISPYGTEYETVNISASSKGSAESLRVIAISKESEYPDIYDFVYEKDTLLLTGYLLEAVPSSSRNDAIRIALENRDVAASIAAAGAPSVKRILPKTSVNYYAPKTLLSVTWKGISALIDPDERKVVQVWRESGGAK